MKKSEMNVVLKYPSMSDLNVSVLDLNLIVIITRILNVDFYILLHYTVFHTSYVVHCL